MYEKKGSFRRVSLAIILAGSIGACRGSKAHPKDELPAAGTPGPAGPSETASTKSVPASRDSDYLEASGVQLLSEYKDNELRADARFKGKVVQVSGTVTDIKNGIAGGTFVVLGTGGDFEIPKIQCILAKGEDGAAMELSRGQKVTVRGTVTGLMMNVALENCVLNPTRSLCQRLAHALGDFHCTQDPETGDFLGLVREGTSFAAMVTCVGARDNHPSEDVYLHVFERFADEDGGKRFAVGSKSARCFTSILSTEGRIPEDLKSKGRAFFDGL